MSLQTWMDEFYPVEADKVPKDQAVQHSLTKWIGLRAENMERHGVYMRLGELREKGSGKCDVLDIDATSCALCHHHFVSEVMAGKKCKTCPLAQVRNGYACDSLQRDAEYNEAEEINPWGHSIRSAMRMPSVTRSR